MDGDGVGDGADGRAVVGSSGVAVAAAAFAGSGGLASGAFADQVGELVEQLV